MMTLEDFKALFRTTPYLYLVMDPDLIIVGASEAYLRSVKRTEEDIVGKYVFDAFPEDLNDPGSTNISEVKASLLRALAKGEPDTTAFVRYSIPVQTPNGPGFEERYWSTVHIPVLDACGKAQLVYQNPVDVTELYQFDQRSQTASLQLTVPSSHNGQNFNRAQMHEALSRILNNEREHLRSLFNQAPGFVAVVMGPKHVFEMCNEAYYQLVGHREVVGKAVWDALPEVAGQGFEAALDSVYKSGVSWSARAMPILVQRNPNGPIEQRYIDLVYEPYKDQYGTTIGVFTQGYDVTDSVQAQTAKRESDERLRDGMDAAKMLVWDLDLTTQELAHSDNIDLVLGLTRATLSDIEKQLHPEDRSKVIQAHHHALSGPGLYSQITRFIRPDNGKQIWLDTRGKVKFDSENRPVGIRGVSVDITERHEAELDLREANRRKDEFLAMLAHELRNPLAPISTAAEMLRMASDSDKVVRKASEVIFRQVKHMTSLVDDLLDVSRVTRGLVELSNEAVDINLVVGAAIEQARPLMQLRQHSLKVHTDPAPAIVIGDRVRLVQVVANLLNNAAKYSPQGGDISLMVHADESLVHIDVQDRGIGIEADLLPHVFDLFTQARRTPDRAQGGLGIGLALVKNMVALHGGQVRAQSEGLGKGSTFNITLPRAPIVESKPMSPGLGDGFEDDAAPVSIMVVDDNVDAGNALAEFMEVLGHNVSVYNHPLTALSAALASPPQVFILDIGLPEIDGYELARRLRADPATSTALFIALTGYGQAHDRTLAKSVGFDHHFVKPVDVMQLQHVFRDIKKLS